MSDARKNKYIPDYLVTPGEVLEDYLVGFGMTQAELATRTGLTKKTINEIIKAKTPITPETALKFERTLGRPAHFWNNLERQFQENRTRLAERRRLELYLDWLDKLPVARMAKLGWIPKVKDKVGQLEAVLRFFGIASPDQWDTVWREYQLAYKNLGDRPFETNAEVVSAWLRQGEIEAQRIPCEPYDRKRFQNILDEIRGLTREIPEVFVSKLVDICASAGVAVVFVPELPQTGVYAATRWLGDKAVIQLSLRYKSNDHFWFTFFHGAAHIQKHGRKDVFIENNDLKGDKEEEAYAFARDILIPPAAYRRLSRGGRPALATIERFAGETGIAPGIVVGRLQRDGVLPINQGNRLKMHYNWVDEKNN